VEQGFVVAIEGIGERGSTAKITGRLDRVERRSTGLWILDFKTGARRSQTEVDSDLQLSLYALACREAYGEFPMGLSLLFLGEEACSEVTTTRTEGQIRDALLQVRALAERIGGGDFHPTPSVPVCSRCPYRGICDATAVRG
jgi:RecB family exonuclease